MVDSPRVRAAGPGDLEAYVLHMVRHLRESGRRGAPVFAPSREVLPEAVRASVQERWARRLDEPLWGRAWVVEVDALVVGHLELRGGRIAEELHRATLGMGLEEGHRGQGHGRRLLDRAIDWARATRKLDFLDLGVFSGNAPARRLYARAGFVEIGTRVAAFRVDGALVDDVMMTLRLRPGGVT